MAYSDRNNTPVNSENKDQFRNSADLLPLFFRTEANKKFLGSTLDTFISKGQLERLNGFVGSRYATGVKPDDLYIPEPNTRRRQFNLLPSVVIRDEFQGRTEWSGTYDDLVNQIDYFNGNTEQHDRLFESKYYAWNPHIDFDKLVNYRQYYWLPQGPSPVTVTGYAEGSVSSFSVRNNGSSAYVFNPDNVTDNPTLILYRGATYKFEVNAPGHPFYIKSAKVIGAGEQYDEGVSGNGAEVGTVSFTVPISAPDNLYYACGVHQSMQGIFEIKNAEEELSIDITTEILGKVNYTSANGVEFTNGLKVNFEGDVTPSTYKNKNYYVEGVGKSIKLIAARELDTPETYSDNFDYEFDIESFDETPFDDAENTPATPEYITINRCSIDKNPWSRYNRWFHKEVIERTATYNNTSTVLDENQRAKRPIIEFEPNIQLYNFATQALGNVDLIDTVTTDVFSDVEGQLGYYVDQTLLLEGMRVTFNADPDSTVQGKIYEVTFVEHQGKERIHLVEKDVPLANQGITITQGTSEQGTSWYFNGTVWVKGQQKTGLNQAPKFELYDGDNIPFSDASYGVGTFLGNELVSYKIGEGTNDSVLGFPVTYQNIANVGDIVFEFDWDDSSFTYNNGTENVTVDTASGLVRINDDLTNWSYESGWSLVNSKLTRQPIVQLDDTIALTSRVEITSVDKINEIYNSVEVLVEYDGKLLKQGNGFRVEQGSDNTRVFVIFDEFIPSGKRIITKIFTDNKPAGLGFYQAPINLTNNAENNDLKKFTLGSATDHFRTIFENDTRVTGGLRTSTNARDVNKIYEHGTRYVKHQGSLLPAIFSLVDAETNIIKAVRKNAQDYNIFKEQFVRTSDNIDLSGNPIDDVDNILYQLSLNRTPDSAYFYSDMVGFGRTVSKLTYTVASATQQVFGINTNYSLSEISDRAVYVYLNDEHLTHGIDYTFDANDNTVTILRDVNIGDVVKINDYDTTGNVVPNTPTKLGLYPKFQPRIFDDNTYNTTTKVIEGHDGSKTVAYGDYRDQLILEFEKRIYNNIKVSYNRSVYDLNGHKPGAFRNYRYSAKQFVDVLKDDFGYWANLYDVDYLSNTVTQEAEPFTYNYSRAIDTVNGEQLPGYWKGIFKKFFDTERPHVAPWEMLGYSEKPTWWQDRYGPAPYTSGNKILWEDLEAGYDFGLRAKNSLYTRPGLSRILPVDEYGDLKSPIACNLVKNFVTTSIEKDFVFGDNAPAEYSWQSSSWYPFALQIANILTNPGEYLTALFDTNQNKVVASGNLVYNRTGKIIDFSEVRVNELYYNDVRFKGAGYHVFITDYCKSFSRNIKERYYDRLQKTSMNLIYKLGGFANKNRLRCLLESSNPQNADTSIFLPQENYEIAYRKSNPVNSAKISGIIVEKTDRGYKVKGYDRYQPVFKIYKPIRKNTDPAINVGGVTAKFVLWNEEKFYGVGQIVQYENLYYRSKQDHTSGTTFDPALWTRFSELPTTGGASAQFATKFASDITEIPYNTVMNTAQEVVDLLLGYQQYLKSIGFTFENTVGELGEKQDWSLSGKEFLFWTTQNWNVGSVISLAPFATACKFTFSNSQVDNVLDSFYEYSILDGNGNPLPRQNISTTRQSGIFTIRPVNTQNSIYYIQLNLVQKEQIIVFDDKTIFGDVVYDQEAGYRQQRIKLVGFKTSEWNGDLYSPGFSYDEAQIQNWSSFTDYNLGDVVKHRGRFYTSKKFQVGAENFNSDNWTLLGEKPIAELLPNFDFKISSFEDFYNLDTESFDGDTAKLSQHLVGYQKRTYLDNLIKNDTAQYKFYQGFIKEKGTFNAIDKLGRIAVDGVQTDLQYSEEWAFKKGTLGSASVVNEIELALDEKSNVDNPQGYDFVAVKSPTGSNIIQVTPNELTVKPSNYANAPWPTTTIDADKGITSRYINKLPVAGYPRLDQEQVTSFDYESLVGNTIISSLNEGDSVWVARDKNKEWTVLKLFANNARVVETDDLKTTANNNLVTFNTDVIHNLQVGQLVSIKNFNRLLDNVYEVNSIPSKTQFTVSATVRNLPTLDSSTGEILEFIDVRIDNVDNINDIEYVTELPVDSRVYADNDGTGKWGIYKKTNAFVEQKWGAPNQLVDQKFGYNLATADNGRLIVVAAPNFGDEGQIYVLQRKFNTDISTLQTVQGYAISDNASDNIVTDSGRPALGFSLALSSDGTVIAAGAPKASNFKSVDDSSRVGFRVSEGDFTVDPSPYSKEGVVTLHTYDTQDNLFKRNYVIGSPDPQTDGHFGQCVLVSPTKLLVGAPGQNSYQGKVFIFDKVVQADGSTLDWQLSENHTLSIPNARDFDQFGFSIAGTSDLSIIAVGAIGREAVGDDSSASKGAVFVYKLNNNEYQLLQTIDTSTFSEITSGDQFGYKIAMSTTGNTMAISAPFSDSQNANAGSVYYFHKTGDDSSVDLYEFQQRIASPQGKVEERFGENLAVNPAGDGIAVYSLGGQNILTTTFDKFTRLGDSTLEDRETETSFDSKTMNIVDENFQSGTVYTYTKLNTKFVFGQKIIAESIDEFDAFGKGLAYTENSLLIGAPLNKNSGVETGSLFAYRKTQTGGWYRESQQDDPTDPFLVDKAFTYNRETDTVKDFLDIIDPVKGKIPYLADAELTYKSDVDPAVYNTSTRQNSNLNVSTAWGKEHVGELWWDLSTVKYVWYEQGDTEYRTTNWGGLFPGSSIDVYEWIEADVPPNEWDEISGTTAGQAQGFSGSVLPEQGGEAYTYRKVYDNLTGQFADRYYYWVKNIVQVPQVDNRRIPASEVATILRDPKAYGVKSLQLTGNNSFSVTNVKTTLDDKNIALSVQYKDVQNDLPSHNEWLLIKEDQKQKFDDTLLNKKLIDSLVGYDTSGNQVPDTVLPIQKKYGIQVRPRQTMFVDRLQALKSIITFVNNEFTKERIVDKRDISRLSLKDPKPVITSGKFDIEVDEYVDLQEIGTQDLVQASATCVLENGRLTAVTIDNRGYGYGVAPEIEIVGDGTGAKASATIDSVGRITSIVVLKKGKDYTSATVVIRPYRALVTVDSTANNAWAIYQWNSASRLWDRVNTQTYDLNRFWKYKDFVVNGFNIDSVVNFSISAPYELNTIQPKIGDLVEVANAGDGNKMILQKIQIGSGTYNRDYNLLYKANSTIEILDSIYDYTKLNFGFAGLESFDLNQFDSEPIQETRLILETIRDDIFVDDLKTLWNEVFFVALRYVFTEQNFVDWAFKTSFVTLKNNLGGFSRKTNYKLSDPGYFEQYINEVKPYSTTIREYITGYQDQEIAQTNSTDFDLPSYFDTQDQKFKVVSLDSEKLSEQAYIDWANNYKYSIGSVIATKQGAGYTEPPLVIFSGGRESKPSITQTAKFRDIVTTDYDATDFYAKTTSIPDHGFDRDIGSDGVAIQNLTFKFPRTPVVAQTKTSVGQNVLGVAVNGVVFYGPKSTAIENRADIPHTVDSVFLQKQAGVTDGVGLPDETKTYFYNANPTRLYTDVQGQHSALIGFALDGNPIYGPYGYDLPNGNVNPRIMKTSYRLKNNARADGSIRDGNYIEDYEYVAGLGDLDQHNGRTCITPEYPNGTYAYFVTVDPNNVSDSVYPYVVGPTLYGVPYSPNGNFTLPGDTSVDATATAYISRGIVREIQVTNPGSGYISAPTITLAGGGGGDSVSTTALAYPILENKKVRINSVNLKFDRISSTKNILTQTQTDTFTATAGQIKFKLTFVPTLDKRKIDININNETVYIENYDVSIVEATDRTYSKKEGYIILNTPPGAGATVVIEYEKSIDLMQAVDRIDYFYQPTAGMLGKDPAQLMTGVEYDGVQVQGLEFDISVGWDGLPWMSHGWDTFSGTNTDFAFRADGSTQTFTLPYTPESGQEINVYFDGVRQDPTNTATITGDGVTDTFTLDIGAPDGTLVVFRQKESDGSLVPTDVNNLDTLLSGGGFDGGDGSTQLFAYTSATGTQPQDISIDGDGFVTVDTSHAPEEVVPGQTFDSLSMSVYNAPADGSPIIETVRYYGDSLTKRYNFVLYPGNNDSIYVTVAGIYREQDTDYTIDYQNKQVVFVDAPEIDELVTIQTLNVAGSKILERKKFTGDGSTTEFELTAKFEDVGNAYVTVDGAKKNYVIRQAGSGSAIIDIENPPPASNSVIQVVALSSVEKTFSKIVKENVNYDGSSTAYKLSNIPGNIAPYHAMVIVEMNGRRLKAPDTIYYTSNGITKDYTVSQDPDYAVFSLALGEIEVHQNGTRLVPIRDYNFDTATNLVSFNENVLSAGDAIAITILKNHEYEVNVTGDSAGDTEANLVVLLNTSEIPTDAVFSVTTFTNHDANLIRKEVFTGQQGGTYTLSRRAIDSNYVWVEMNGRPLVADRDYKVLDNNNTVYIDDKFNDESTVNDVVITTFSEDVSYDSVGYKIFKDMLNRTHFKRISEQDSTTLAVELKPTDETITLSDASFLQTPSPENNVPGVLWVDRERIEFYTVSGNTLGQITRGTLGTGVPNLHSAGTVVSDAGPNQTIPYAETTNVYTSVIRPGLPNGRSIHVLETININANADAHDQVEVYLGNRKLQKPTATGNPITEHDAEIAYDSNETNSAGTSSDVVQQEEFRVEPVTDSTGKNYYQLVLTQEPQDGLELKVVQKQGKVWYEQGLSTASVGTTLQRNETAQAKFLLERPSGLPVINIRE